MSLISLRLPSMWWRVKGWKGERVKGWKGDCFSMSWRVKGWTGERVIVFQCDGSQFRSTPLFHPFCSWHRGAVYYIRSSSHRAKAQHSFNRAILDMGGLCWQTALLLPLHVCFSKVKQEHSLSFSPSFSLPTSLSVKVLCSKQQPCCWLLHFIKNDCLLLFTLWWFTIVLHICKE